MNNISVIYNYSDTICKGEKKFNMICRFPIDFSCTFFSTYFMVAQFSAQDRVMSANFLKWKKMKTFIRFYNDRKSVPSTSVVSTSVVSTSSTTDAPVPEPVEGTATKPKLP